MELFNFYHKKHDLNFQGSKVVNIEENITDKLVLFERYADSLNIPSYYGKNWNAFDDNLMSLYFVTENKVYIIHHDIPFNNDEETKRMYLETLFDTVRHWWEFPEHKFYVYFPENCKNEVTRIIDSRAYD